MSRVAKGLSIVAGGAVSAGRDSSSSFYGEGDRAAQQRGGGGVVQVSDPPPPPSAVPLPLRGRIPTLSELFAASPRDSGWAGFLLPQIDRSKPVLWVQERMGILESGRVYPPGLGQADILHVEARDARDALWAMEEGVRCSALSAVIGRASCRERV